MFKAEEIISWIILFNQFDINNLNFVKIDGNSRLIQKRHPHQSSPSTHSWSLFQLAFERNIRTHTHSHKSVHHHFSIADLISSKWKSQPKGRRRQTTHQWVPHQNTLIPPPQPHEIHSFGPNALLAYACDPQMAKGPRTAGNDQDESKHKVAKKCAQSHRVALTI